MAYFYESHEHTAKMEELFSKEIKDCINNTSVYRVMSDFNPTNIDITVEALTTSESVAKYNGSKRLCCLNFASFRHPGGSFGYKEVHLAQEEWICKDSFLYNILKEFKKEYVKNSFCNNYDLYENFALYSPDVVFVDTEYNPIAKCDVLTCAAPNAKVARKNYNVDTKDIEHAMRQRIDFVLSTAKAQGVKTFILGAFGCGVFENDPTFVSQTFKHLLDTKDYGFEKVIFAIPGGPNLKAFQKIFYTKY